MGALITIGITCYNAQDTIAAAIESALAQDWPDKEIIVIDDASDDESAALIARYPVQYVRQSLNKGVAAARNEIILRAKGTFIAFFDDDDVSMPQRLSRQYRRITDYEARHGTTQIVCHSARLQIYPSGRTHYEATIGMNEKSQAPQGQIVARRILMGRPFRGGHGSIATCSQMARARVYHSLGGFDETFRRGEDTDFALRHACSDGIFLGIADTLVRQTMTHGQEKTIEQDTRSYQRLYQKHAGYLAALRDNGFSPAWLTVRQTLAEGNRGAGLSMLTRLFLKYPIRTIRKLIWTWPNRAFNSHYKYFHAKNA